MGQKPPSLGYIYLLTNFWTYGRQKKKKSKISNNRPKQEFLLKSSKNAP